jgi:hypothetical protein
MFRTLNITLCTLCTFCVVCIVLFIALFIAPSTTYGQDSNAVGRVTVNRAAVEMRRVRTETFVPLRRSSLVGVGDHVRTDASGRTVVTFFDGVLFVDVLADTEIEIEALSGDAISSEATVSVLRGFTTHRAALLLDDKDNYRIKTPGMSAVLLEGSMNVRVEPDGRSAIFVGGIGRVEVTDAEGNTATITQGLGVRTDAGGTLSEVVPASSFPILDSALDGCASSIRTIGDTRMNVRQGASFDFPRIGGLDNGEPIRVMGIATSGDWYRIRYRGGFAWIISPRLPVEEGCAGLRIFPDAFGPEDASLYENLVDPIELIR